MLFLARWLFHGARFSACPTRKTAAVAGPPAAALPPPHDHPRTGWGGGGPPQEAGQRAVNSQGSCFLSWCRFPVSVWRAVGQSPRPLSPPSLPPSGMRTAATFLRQREFLLSCLPLFAVVSKAESSLFTECPTASGSSRWPLRRALQPPGLLVPSPGVFAALPSGTFSFAWSRPPPPPVQ